jgi:lipopolysaccharide transport system ATP-binding protein
VTHWKAGSQWVAQILNDCAPDQTVRMRHEAAYLLPRLLESGRIYPAVYLTRERLDMVQLPANAHILVVVRDLRDTLVSLYFSELKSHAIMREVGMHRPILSTLSVEDGLIDVMDSALADSARIQISWLEAGHRLIRYEDLIENDLAMFGELLIEQCGLPLSEEQLRGVVLANRFERYTGGRARGEEDQGHHFRKGVAGDWKNHFTERVKAAFKARYGGLLVATGYEPDLSW